jgi:hypothetical protein
MQAAPQKDWIETETDELETVLDLDRSSRLLVLPRAALKLGGRPTGPDVRLGPLRVRIGRKPTVHNLRLLYKRRGRGIPEEFDVYWSHEIWMLQHTVGVLCAEDSVEASGLEYEMVLDERAIIQGVLPEERLMHADSGGHAQCRADILLNGRIVPEFGEPAGEELANLAGGALEASSRDDVVGRVWLPALTTHVCAIGPGCHVATWVFRRNGNSLSGSQPMATTLLLEKHIRTLSCKVQVRLQAQGRSGVAVPLGRSNWATLDIDLYNHDGP